MSGHDLGPSLEAFLIHACDGAISDVRWFRTDWQRGGAATGYCTIEAAGGERREAVIKAPVGPQEYRVLAELGADPDAPTPRVAFHGTELGPFDMAWAVMERVPGEPLRSEPSKKSFLAVTRAAAGFYARAQATWPLDVVPPRTDWLQLLSTARDAAKMSDIPDKQRWSNAIHDVQKIAPRLVSVWNARPINTWLHGDLHLANAMSRPADSPWARESRLHESDDEGNTKPSCVLIDFGEMRPGHWSEDAIYLERLYWTDAEVMKKVKPAKLLATARKKAGLPTDEGDGELLQIRRLLMAACVPAFLHREGHPAYLKAALEMIDRTLPVLQAA